jgi:hypothetical protein
VQPYMHRKNKLAIFHGKPLYRQSMPFPRIYQDIKYGGVSVCLCEAQVCAGAALVSFLFAFRDQAFGIRGSLT